MIMETNKISCNNCMSFTKLSSRRDQEEVHSKKDRKKGTIQEYFSAASKMKKTILSQAKDIQKSEKS